jgi:hypothetical protein
MKQYKIKLLVFGGRNYKDYTHAYKVLDFFLQNYTADEILIVQGDALGADKIGKDYAIEKGMDHDDYPADWNNLDVERCVVKYNKYGKPYNAIAGHNRNADMEKVSTHGLGFWDQKSTGTKDMRDRLKKAGKVVKIIPY